jgi:antitoxin MazE
MQPPIATTHRLPLKTNAVYTVVYTQSNMTQDEIMTSVTQSIKPWGNSLGLRLPAVIAKAVGLHADQCVKISTKGQTVIITPCEQKPLSLEERLARFDPARHGGEVMNTDNPLGAEKW